MTGLGEHITVLQSRLRFADWAVLDDWADRIVSSITHDGGRLLVAGNGGSAAQAQHLTAELVGRFRDERRSLSAIALHAETSSVTAIANDYNYAEVFARQVRAHGRPGDVLLLLSTSGRSENLLRAARAAAEMGVWTLAMTGAGPNPLQQMCCSSLSFSGESATVQECHLVALHELCRRIDARIPSYIQPAANTVASGAGLVVVGDAFLDRDYRGPRRAPVRPDIGPVVAADTVIERPGGAALTAVLAAGHTHEPVVLVAPVGREQAGTRCHALLQEAGVEVVDLAEPGDGDIAVKTRIIEHAAGAMVRFDTPSTITTSESLRPEALATLSAAGGLVVADYGTGLLESSGLRVAIGAATERAPVVWDPHPRGAIPVHGVTAVVPNIYELAEAVGSEPADSVSAAITQARELATRWKQQAVAVTRGRHGAVLVDHSSALPVSIAPSVSSDDDACGAGDMFAAALAIGLVDGKSLTTAMVAAVESASTYVVDRGLGCQPAGARHHVPARPAAACTEGQPPGKVVATSGCFDLLHVGHVEMLRQARALGDRLIVCLNSDASVRRIKGRSRPLVPAENRAAVLEALAHVDEVQVFDEDTPDSVLDRIRPDIYVKGGDYAVMDMPERGLVESWGGQVVLVPYLDRHSTSKLVSTGALLAEATT